MISSNAISSHSTDTAAVAACVNAASCYGISYEPSLAASVRGSARRGGAGAPREHRAFTLSSDDGCLVPNGEILSRNGYIYTYIHIYIYTYIHY